MTHIGFNNMVNKERIIAIADMAKSPMPIRRAVQHARDKGKLIDLTCGRKTGTVFFMDNGDVVLSYKAGITVKKHLVDYEETLSSWE